MSKEENLMKAAEIASKNHKVAIELGLFSERTVNIMRNATSSAFTASLILYGSCLAASAIHNKLVMPYLAKQLLKDKKIAELLMKG